MIYPKFYFCKQKVSDRDWMLSRINCIPDEHKQAVSDEYERLYSSCAKEGRGLANTYLNNEAKKWSNLK